MRHLVARVLLLFVLSLGFLAKAELCPQHIVHLVTTEYPPYQSESARDGGVFDALAVKAFNEVGCKVNIERTPWTRALIEAEHGSYDGILGVWHSQEREKWFLFSGPLFANQLVVISRAKDNLVFDKKKLSKLSMALVMNYAYPDEVRNLPVERMEYSPDDKMCLLMLAGGRVDFIVLDKTVAEYLLATDLNYLKAKLHLGEVLAEIPLYAAFSLKTGIAPELAENLKKGLRKLEKEKKLDELRKRAAKNFIKMMNFRRL